MSYWSSEVCSSDLVGRIGIGELDQIIVFTDVRGRSVLGGFVDSALRRRAGDRGRRDLLGLRRLVFGTARQQQRAGKDRNGISRSEEHTSELQSLMRISYAVFCLKKKNNIKLSKNT